MSLMQYNNLSLLTYGALGLTGIILAVATVYEASGPSAPAVESESSGSPISDMISNVTEPISDTFSSKPAQEPGLFGGKKNKKRKTKKQGVSNKSEKKSRKTKHRKSKIQNKSEII
jgi:hypothetical protein